MRKLLFILLAPLALGAAAQGQGGLWLGADVSYDITSRLGAEVEIGGRLEDNFTSFNRYDAAFGLSYKPLKWLKLGASYDFIRDYNPGEAEVLYRLDDHGAPVLDTDGNPIVKGVNVDDAFWRTKHRAAFDVTGKWKAGRFGFSLRERYQFTHYAPTEVNEWKYRDEYDADEYQREVEKGADPARFYGPVAGADGEDYYYELKKSGLDTKGSKQKHYLRSRLAIDYNIRRCPITPFVSYEIANDLGDGFSVVRHRASAGFDWNLTRNKQHALSLAYIYQHGAREEVGNADLHIISIGYKFSLESPRAKAQRAAKKKAKKNKQ